MEDDVSGIGDITHSDALQLLADGHRRELMRTMRDVEGVVSVADLAAGLADGPPETEERLAALLHHVHLPKLDAYGIVEYDAASRHARPGVPDAIAGLVDSNG